MNQKLKGSVYRLLIGSCCIESHWSEVHVMPNLPMDKMKNSNKIKDSSNILSSMYEQLSFKHIFRLISIDLVDQHSNSSNAT